MKTVRWFTFAVMLLPLWAGCQPRLPEAVERSQDVIDVQRITVMTYNVLGGRNPDGARDLDRISDVIKAIDPDIVALQEVDRGTMRLNGLDLAAELAARTNLTSEFGRAMEYDDGEYGVAILSRFAMERVDNFALPHLDESEPRTALAVSVTPPGGGEPFLFVATHLDHQRDSTDRVVQARHLRNVLTQYDKLPGVLAGDLNDKPGSVPLAILDDAWEDTRTSGGEGFTFSSDQPRVRIDYILVRPAGRWSVVRTFTGAEIRRDDRSWQDLLVQASDHLPVVAVLEMLP